MITNMSCSVVGNFGLNHRFRARATNEINYVDFDNLLRRYSGDIEPF